MPRYLSLFLPAWAQAAPTGPREEAQAEREKRLGLIADWCRRFTPLAASDAPDGLVLDIAGAAHLFGGEAALARAHRGQARPPRRAGRPCRHARSRMGAGAPSASIPCANACCRKAM